VRTEQATVYRLSNTLTLIVTEAGRVSLQRNLREPVELNPAEMRNLVDAVSKPHTTIGRADR
jgi:hypothetical protein